jgi:erythromycin esterase
MSGISRRSLLKTGGLCVGAAVARGMSWGQANGDAWGRWIERNAVRIGDGVDERGATERVIAAIGDARIVMLGEPSHGAGSAFAAKVALVEMLHERMGFDVLIWESGLIDLERTEEGLHGDADPVQAAQRGILKIWSASAECRPLFEYAKASHRGARPLTMAGFDMQLTAGGSLEYFSAELRAFVDTLTPAARRKRAEMLANNVLEHFGRMNRYIDALAAKNAELGRAGVMGAAQGAAMKAWEESDGDRLRPSAADLDQLRDAAGELQHLLQGTDHAGEAPAGREGFMARAVAGLAGYGANLFETYGKHTAEETARYAVGTENRRDQINAENLRWLIDKAYAGRKVMVWAHNAHVMNAWYSRGFDSVSPEPVPDGMKSMGVWLTKWYGGALYKIGLTTYEGSDGWVGSKPEAVPAAPEGSLEERLHRLGAKEAFLPLRGGVLPTAPVSMRIPKYKEETVSNPAQAFDALYFIDRMKPASAI